MSILDVPERIAMMLYDAHPAIKSTFHYTQAAIDEIEKPCWLVFVEDASYPQIGVNQELVEQSYSLAFIGNTWSDTNPKAMLKYEKLTREIAEATILYFLEHPQLQMSNIRGNFNNELISLNGVHSVKIGSRSAVTLYSREAVAGDAFWGFTIDITVIQQLPYSTVGLP
jgi:hypothetical protein